MNNKNWLRSRFLLFSYLFVWLIILIAPSNKISPPLGVTLIQLYLTFNSILALSLCKGKSIRSILLFVFIIHLSSSIILRLFYIETFNNPLGSISVDSTYYHELAKYTSSFSFSEHLRFLIDGGDFDDIGMPTIMYLAYKIVGAGFGIHLMLLVNTFFITISCKYLYKLSSFFLSRNVASVITVLWGTMPFSITTSADGLKENFFVTFLIIGVYYVYKYFYSSSVTDLIKALIYGSMVVFFRMATLPVYFLFLFVIILNKKVKSDTQFLIVSFLALVSICLIIPLALSFLLNLRGFSLETFSEMSALQYDSVNGGYVGLLNAVFGIVGSLPSFLSTPDKVNYITVSNFASFLTLLLSSFYLHGIIISIKERDDIFPLSVITILNSIMIILMSFSFDFRYRFLQLPFTLILAAYTITKISRKQIGYHSMYQIFICLFIIYYNIS